jgi:hypothetical protein
MSLATSLSGKTIAAISSSRQHAPRTTRITFTDGSQLAVLGESSDLHVGATIQTASQHGSTFSYTTTEGAHVAIALTSATSSLEIKDDANTIIFSN